MKSTSNPVSFVFFIALNFEDIGCISEKNVFPTWDKNVRIVKKSAEIASIFVFFPIACNKKVKLSGYERIKK